LICGWPHEGPERLDAIRDFADRVPDMPWLSLSTPFPGTALERYLHKAGVTSLPYESGVYDTNRFAFVHPSGLALEFYARLMEFYSHMGTEETIGRKIGRLAGDQFEPWATESVQQNLQSLGLRASRLYESLASTWLSCHHESGTTNRGVYSSGDLRK
jgi:hypothetical protein